MISSSIFREYDIRGIVGRELNEQTVKLIGYHLGLQTIKRTDEKTPFVVIGYDARTHSPEMFGYLTSGFNSAGCKVMGMGMVATGVNYFASYQTFNGIKPAASVMITGSHNPSDYNGFKITIDNAPFFGEDIYSMGDEIVAFQKEIEDDEQFIEIDVKSLYIDYMIKEFDFLKGMKPRFMIDCGNGVADTVLTAILDKLELNYEALYATPDGTFPNHHPDPSVEENLKDVIEALKGDFDYGFAYDGDADRIAFLTKKHNVKGDIMALLFAKTMKNPVIVGEVKCTQIMYDIINESGGQAVMYKTGHSNLKVKLKELNADMAAEVSGHIFFNDRYFGYDDAVYATFRLLELIFNGMDIDKEIEALPQTFSTEEIKVYTTEDEKFILMDKVKELLSDVPDDFPKIIDIIDVDGVRVIFEDGWGLVRASNTTPVLVTRFESTIQAKAKLYETKLNDLIQRAKDELS